VRIEKLTRAGREFAIISIEDLQRLTQDAEMLADVAAFDRAKARIERGQDELIPLEITSGASQVRTQQKSGASTGA
jgi:hypothetical protein